MTGHSPHGPGREKWNVGRCPDCGKLRYATRSEARKAARQQGGHLHPYRCGDYWHLTSYSHLQRAAYREYDARRGKK